MLLPSYSYIVFATIILCITVVIWYIRSKWMEPFYQHIQRLRITPSRAVYSDTRLYTWYPDTMVHQLGQAIQTLYPIATTVPSDKSTHTLLRVKTEPYSLGFVSSEIFTRVPSTGSVHVVGTVGYEQFTIVGKISDTTIPLATLFQSPTTTIGVSSLNDPTYDILLRLGSLYSVSSDSLKQRIHSIGGFQSDSILSAFQSNTIQLFCILCSQPNRTLIQTIRDSGGSLDIRGLNLSSEEGKSLFPRASSTDYRLSMRDFGLIERTPQKTLEFPLLLISNPSFPKDDISRLFYTLYTKSSWIKSQGDSYYQEQIQSWSPSSLFEILQMDNITIHPVVYEIMETNGYIHQGTTST